MGHPATRDGSHRPAKKLGEERIRHAWAQAYEVHVWGFHEAKYRVEDVEATLPLAKWLLEYTKKTLERQESNTAEGTPRTQRRRPSRGSIGF